MPLPSLTGCSATMAATFAGFARADETALSSLYLRDADLSDLSEPLSVGSLR